MNEAESSHFEVKGASGCHSLQRLLGARLQRRLLVVCSVVCFIPNDFYSKSYDVFGLSFLFKFSLVRTAHIFLFVMNSHVRTRHLTKSCLLLVP